MKTWPTELQTQIMSGSNAQARINPRAEEVGGGALNNSNTPEEVLVWEEMDVLTCVIHNG